MNEPFDNQLSSLDAIDGHGATDDLADDGAFLGEIKGLVEALFRHKLAVLVVVAAGVVAGWFWLQQQTPVYEASARVVIGVHAPRVLSNVQEVVALGSGRSYNHEMFFESEYQVIKSHDVATRVLDQLGLWNDEHLLGLDRPGLELNADEKREIISEINQPQQLSGRIDVVPVPNSMLVDLTFQDTDEEFAQTLANAYAEAYRDQNLVHRREVVDSATEELKSLSEDWERRFKDAASVVRSFEGEHQVGTIANTKKATDNRLVALSTELTAVAIQRIQLESKANALTRYKRASRIKHIANGTLLEDENIRTLAGSLAQKEADLAGLKARYLDQHPEVTMVQEQINSLRLSLRTAVRNQAKAAEREHARVTVVEQKLRDEIQTAKQEEREISDLELQYQQRVDEMEQIEKQFEEVRKRYIETLMSAQVEANNIRVLDRAVSARQVRPRPAVIMSASLIFALLLAGLLVFVLEFSDSTIKDWHELRDRLKYRVLGVLPVIALKSEEEEDVTTDASPSPDRFRDLYIYDHTRSQAAEAFRALRTNLLFLSTARNMKSLVITSANPSEGKTTIAISTAISMAMSGKRTVLVEADMRRPRFHKSFNLADDVGLTAGIAGKGSIVEQVQGCGVENLGILPCGPIPPNPAELIHTPRFREIFDELRDTYDFVIFDSPPVNPVADALVLGRLVEGCMIVVRAGTTTRQSLAHATRQLREVGVNFLGTVLNYRDVKRSRYGYGYGRGSYGYGNGSYGYGTYGYNAPYGPVDDDESA